MKKSLLVGLLSAVTGLSAHVTYAAENSTPLKLYRLNCGEIHVSDLNAFSDTLQYPKQQKDLVVSCYVIQDGKNILLWDTGLPNAIANNPQGTTQGIFTLKLPKTIAEQLKEIGLTPEQITHVAISHGHFDHAGNVDAFKNAKLIMQESEYNLIKNQPDVAKKYHMEPEKYARYLTSPENVQLLQGDTDIFSDGKIQAISLPGHTPGHMAALIKLKKNYVVLSGDQWHFRENHDSNGVPGFNYNRADTLASSDKLNALIKNTKATLIIQHEPKDVQNLPIFPKYAE